VSQVESAYRVVAEADRLPTWKTASFRTFWNSAVEGTYQSVNPEVLSASHENSATGSPQTGSDPFTGRAVQFATTAAVLTFPLPMVLEVVEAIPGQMQGQSQLRLV